jgi:hypothetical protein
MWDKMGQQIKMWDKKRQMWDNNFYKIKNGCHKVITS